MAAPGESTTNPDALSADREVLADVVEDLATELERRTRALETSEARFRAVIERNADAIVVVDRCGVVRFVNASAVEMFGTSSEALLGADFGFPVVADETTELDLLVQGTRRVAEMRVVESEWEGEIACIASLRDITERKEAELTAQRLVAERAARAAADELSRQQRFLLESTTLLSSSLDYSAVLSALARLCVGEIADWVVIYDVDDRGRPRRLDIAHWDPSKEPLTRELKAIAISPDGPHPVVEVLRTRQPRMVTEVPPERLAAMTQNARELWLTQQLGVGSYMQVPMIARDRALGAITFVSSGAGDPFTEQDLGLAQNIAARAALAIDNARLYAAARRANQTKAEFLAVVSHDLRTPLNAVMGYAELLEIGIPDPLGAKALERVSRIRTSARHLLYLLDELLAFARLDAGHEELRLADTNVNDVARDVATVMEPLALQRGLRFVIEPAPRALVVRTDPDKLRQVLINLVGNAVKYTEQGEVRLAVDARPDGVTVVRVRDTGVGIAPEHIDQIFEPFWQVDRTQRSKGGGTGLGLSVVRRMVELLGGEVTVASAPGAGSVFTVTLPQGAGE